MHSTGILCEPLLGVENGMIIYSSERDRNYPWGTTATYSCNEGYFLDTSGTSRIRTCIDDNDGDAEGVFDGQEPRCARKLPFPPQNIKLQVNI